MRNHLSQQFEGQDWTRWPQQQPQPTEYHHMMSTPPLMPFDSPPTMAANDSKHIVTHSLGPSYMMPNQYQPGPPYDQAARSQYPQPMPFAYSQYSSPAPTTPMTPPFEAQPHRRPDGRLLSPIDAHANMHSRPRPAQYHGVLGSPAKPEHYVEIRPDSANSMVDGPRKDVNPIRPDDPTKQVEFNTPIDNLMRRYQSLGAQQASVSSPQLLTPAQSPRYTGARRLPGNARKLSKTFQCDKCDYVSSQKAHLNAHKRTHTSELPYQCPHCGKRCSQKGNLDVHIRAHKGERVFKCEHPGCDSAGFFSRSNLVAHKKIHMTSRHKWVCKLEGCTKSFSSTGNRKAHHNKFHEQEFARLTVLIDEYNKTGQCPEQDRLMVEELAQIYKNSNKGIKGRGKGVKVHKVASAPQPEIQFATVNWSNKVPMAIEDRPVNVGSVTQMLGPMYHRPEHSSPMDMMYRPIREH